MNTPLPLHDLASAIGARGTGAYVLTVSEPGVPHVVHAEIVRDGDRLLAMVGAHTADNARRQPRVSLNVPRESGDYSLIVDAVATVEATADGPCLILAATRAVLHRSGPAPDPAPRRCSADCQPLTLGALGRGRPA